jgi:hypothetical protein
MDALNVMDYQAWCKESDEEIQEIDLILEKQKIQYSYNQDDIIKKYKEKYGDYWKYYNIHIPINIRSIPAHDKVNTVYLFIYDGTYEIVVSHIKSKLFQEGYTPNEYSEKFCEYDKKNDRWVYVGKK